jgi:Phage capsid family
VSPDWMGPGGEDPPYDEPAPEPDYGDRPAGMRPGGVRPAGMRPAGMRPAGMRPAGMRPAGMRPAGMRPAGMRPAGMRPAGMRPAGMRDDDEFPPGLDPEEWSADVADLFCACSAVIRSGARLVVGHADLLVPSEPLRGAPEYLPRPVTADHDEDVPQRLGAGQRDLRAAAAAADASLATRRLRPRDHELTLRIAVRDQLVRALTEQPEVAWALKEDIARSLALRADHAFLHGDGDDGPRGIDHVPGVGAQADRASVLETARAMVASLRGDDQRHFASAGWILSAGTLQQLAEVVTRNALVADADGASLDSLGSGQLLGYDGADGGMLLGYPFIVSAAAGAQMYFSSDWREAWVGADPGLVTVRISTDARFQTDETVLRAVAHHDLDIRRPSFFVHT